MASRRSLMSGPLPMDRRRRIETSAGTDGVWEVY